MNEKCIHAYIIFVSVLKVCKDTKLDTGANNV